VSTHWNWQIYFALYNYFKINYFADFLVKSKIYHPAIAPAWSVLAKMALLIIQSY